MTDSVDQGGRGDRILAWLMVVPPFLGVVFGMYFPPRTLSRSLDLPRAGLAISAAVAIVALLIRPEIRERVRANARDFWVPLALLFAVLIVGTLVSGNIAEAVFGGTGKGLLPLAALTLVAVTVTGLTRHVRKAMYLIVPPVLVIEIFVTYWLLSKGQEGQGTAANTVILAQVLLLTIPFVVVPSGSRTQSRVEKVLRYALAGAAVLTLGLSGSRIGLIAGVGLLVTVIVAQLPAFSLRDPRARWPLVAVGVGVAALIVAGLTGPWRHKYLSMFSGEWFLSNRAEWWRTAWKSFLDSPIIGHGPDSYSSEMVRLMRVGKVVKFEALVGDPHNIILTTLQVCGLVGLAAVIWLAVATWRNWRRQGRRSVYLASGIVATLLTCLIEPLALQVLPVFALVLGASLSPPRQAEAPEESAVQRVSGAVVLATTGLLSAYLLLSSLAVLAAWPPQPANAGVGDARRIQLAADIVHFDPFLYQASSTAWWYASQRTGDPALGERTLAAMARAVQLAPENPYLALDLARYHVAFGWPKSVITEKFERAVELWPRNPNTLIDYARYLSQTGSLEAATVRTRQLAAVIGTESLPPDLGALLGSGETSASP